MRVTWLEQIKADELRTGLVPLPVWKRKGKKNAAKRQGSKLTLDSGKKRKVEESQKKSSPRRKVILLSDSDVSDSSRNCLEWGSGLALSNPELESIAAARS